MLGMFSYNNSKYIALYTNIFRLRFGPGKRYPNLKKNVYSFNPSGKKLEGMCTKILQSDYNKKYPNVLIIYVHEYKID